MITWAGRKQNGGYTEDGKNRKETERTKRTGRAKSKESKMNDQQKTKEAGAR